MIGKLESRGWKREFLLFSFEFETHSDTTRKRSSQIWFCQFGRYHAKNLQSRPNIDFAFAKLFRDMRETDLALLRESSQENIYFFSLPCRP